MKVIKIKIFEKAKNNPSVQPINLWSTSSVSPPLLLQLQEMHTGNTSVKTTIFD